jgi:hypothetical protein
MLKHDQLTTGWQVFLFNVVVDEQKGLLCFGLALIGEGLKEVSVRIHDPDQPQTSYIVQLPPEYLGSNQSIVHLRKSLPYRRVV